MDSEFFVHRGIQFQVAYDQEGSRRWTVFRDGLPRETGQVIRDSKSGSFRHAIAAAQAAIDAGLADLLLQEMMASDPGIPIRPDQQEAAHENQYQSEPEQPLGAAMGHACWRSKMQA